MHVDDRVLAACVVQDALSGRGFTGVNVGNDTDVADIRKGGCTSHYKFPSQH